MMNLRRNIYATIIIVLLQVGFFTAWTLREELAYTPQNSTLIRVLTRPVDPRDLLSGNYLVLNYDFNRGMPIRDKDATNTANDVWAVLSQRGEYHVTEYLTAKRPRNLPHGSVAIHGTSFGYDRYEFGIEKFFINENTKEPPGTAVVDVFLLVNSDYSARIQKILVNGIEFKP